jgi:hypothetical protein
MRFDQDFGRLKIPTSPEILGSSAEGPMHDRPRVAKLAAETSPVSAKASGELIG